MHICPQEIIPILMVAEVIVPYTQAIYYTKVVPLFRYAVS